MNTDPCASAAAAIEEGSATARINMAATAQLSVKDTKRPDAFDFDFEAGFEQDFSFGDLMGTGDGFDMDLGFLSAVPA